MRAARFFEIDQAVPRCSGDPVGVAEALSARWAGGQLDIQLAASGLRQPGCERGPGAVDADDGQECSLTAGGDGLRGRQPPVGSPQTRLHPAATVGEARHGPQGPGERLPTIRRAGGCDGGLRYSGRPDERHLRTELRRRDRRGDRGRRRHREAGCEREHSYEQLERTKALHAMRVGPDRGHITIMGAPCVACIGGSPLGGSVFPADFTRGLHPSLRQLGAHQSALRVWAATRRRCPNAAQTCPILPYRVADPRGQNHRKPCASTRSSADGASHGARD